MIALSLQAVFSCLLVCLVIFCCKPDMLHWIIESEVNRPYVWGFIWLGSALCLMFAVVIAPEASNSSVLAFVSVLMLVFPNYSSSRVCLAVFSCNPLWLYWSPGGVVAMLGDGNSIISRSNLNDLVGRWPSQVFHSAPSSFPCLKLCQYISLKAWPLLCSFPLGWDRKTRWVSVRMPFPQRG